MNKSGPEIRVVFSGKSARVFVDGNEVRGIYRLDHDIAPRDNIPSITLTIHPSSVICEIEADNG